jgi:short-subunit dehydrogenase
MELNDKVAILTGAGSGIGRATAMALAGKGVKLVLFGRTKSKLDDTAAAVMASGGSAVVVIGDVTDPVARATAIDTALTRFGKLDILVNNAGNVRGGRLQAIEEAEIRAMIDVDLLSPILFAKQALPALLRSGDGAIVNVSSAIALVGAPFYTTYAAVKAGLARFGEALRRELLDEGVHVLTIYPGATDTPMMATNKAGPELGFSRETPEAVAAALVGGLEANALEVIRGGEVRMAMITANRDRPQDVDERFRKLKPELEKAVANHRAI